MVDFPETPQIDDSVNILNFLPYHSQERNHLREYLEEKRLNFTLKVIERTWSIDTNGTYLIVELGTITSEEVILPAVPSVGHQIFLSDFITEDEENKIFRKYPNMNINLLIVKHVTWLRKKKLKRYTF